MGTWLRFIVYAFGSYLFFRIGYPEPGYPILHVLMMIGLAGVATIGAFFAKILFVGRPVSNQAGFELIFFLIAFGATGMILPNKYGPPLQLLLHGVHPTQYSVHDGLKEVGLDPDSEPARRFIGLFPAK